MAIDWPLVVIGALLVVVGFGTVWDPYFFYRVTPSIEQVPSWSPQLEKINRIIGLLIGGVAGSFLIFVGFGIG